MKPYRCRSCQIQGHWPQCVHRTFKNRSPNWQYVDSKAGSECDRWKYSCFNDGVAVDELGSRQSFRDNISLVSLGDSPKSTPDAKRQNLVSPFDDLNDTIPFENDADDLNVSFSDLFVGSISTDPQMEFEHSDLIHDMHSLVQSVCKCYRNRSRYTLSVSHNI